MKYIFRFILIIAFNLTVVGYAQIYINEVMADNNSGIVDENGDRFDWIELYNASDKAVNLKGYALTDQRNSPKKWRFSSLIVKSKGFTIVYASSSEESKGGNHSNFSISKKGEKIWLFNKKGELIDSVDARPCNPDVSWGRMLDGNMEWERMYTATPGESNAGSIGVIFSKKAGFYTFAEYLTVKTKNSGYAYYTMSGHKPYGDSNPFFDSLLLMNRIDEPDFLSNFRTGQRKPNPREDNFKAVTIRAACYNNEGVISAIYTRTYFILHNYKTRYPNVQIAAISMDPKSLVDEYSGIYIAGHSEPSDPIKENYNQRGIDWERSAHLELFNDNHELILSDDVGIRIHGSTSRKNGQKSLRIYAREFYGAPSFKYREFEDEQNENFKHLVLRNGMSCWQKTVFKDELTTYLCRGLNFERLDAKTTIVFLNGEYWGIHSLRPYFNEDYLAEKEDCDKDSINIVLHGANNFTPHRKNRRVVVGNATSHFKIYDILKDSTITDKYAELSQLIDIDCFIDFYAAQLFFANRDFLENNNKMWSVGQNGKWRHLFYDLDGAFESAQTKSFSVMMSDKSHSRAPLFETSLFRGLMASDEFKTQFFNRFKILLETNFSTENLLKGIEKFKTDYLPLIDEHIGRWGVPGSVHQWEGKVAFLESFARVRKDILIADIIETFGEDFGLK